MSSEKKYRMTHQRGVILQQIRSDHSHPTADEIYEKVRKKLPRISMGTVYRNLDILTSSGHITKLDPDRTQMRFDGNTITHYHITCMHCGRVDDVDIEPTNDVLVNLENALEKLTKHGIFGHKLEFLGLCSQCRMAAKKFPEDEEPV